MRFPEFKGEWTLDEIENVVSNKSQKYVPSSNEHFVDIELENMMEGGGIIYPIADSSTQKSTKNRFFCGNVLYGKLRPYLNKVWKASFDGVCSSEIWVLSSLKLDSDFLYSFCQTPYFKSLANTTCGSKMPRADWDLISSSLIKFPQNEEQKKIGNFMLQLDQKIDIQRKTIEDYEKLMNVGINTEYSDEKALAKIGSKIIQSTVRNSMNIGNVYSVSNKDGFIPQKDQFEGREVASENTSNYKIVEKGIFAFNPARINVGSIALYELDEPCVVSPMYICFKPTELNANYLRYFFRTQSFKKQLHSKLEGSVRQCLSFEALREFYLPNRSFNHIAKFCDGIHALEGKINSEKHILESLVMLKYYLLRNLFI